jgi:hypothetical protein
MKKLSIIILSVSLLIACNKESGEMAVQSKAGVIQTPENAIPRVFKGNIYSELNLDPSIPPMACTGDLPGLFLPDHFLHGNMTHTGELIWEQSKLRHLSCNLSFVTRQLTASVSGQLATANGDLVFYSGNDVIDVTNLLTGGGPTGSIEGTWNITGGTGRFAGASGSFTINGTVDFTTGTFSCSANGTIIF